MPPEAIEKKDTRSKKIRLAGSSVLIFSILFHVGLGILSTWVIVAVIANKKKAQFTEAAPIAEPLKKEVEHKVQLAHKQNSMAAPPDVVERITTTGLSNVELPQVDMPEVSATATGTSKMDGAELGGLATGGPAPMEVDTGAMAASVFGALDSDSPGLEGWFYDLKRNKDGTLTHLDPAWGYVPNGYASLLRDYIKQGFPDDFFENFWKAPKPIFATQIMVPYLLASEGPKAFGQPQIAGVEWIIVYNGKFTVSHPGTYRFVGFADDVLEISLNKRHVLTASDGILWDTHDPQQTDHYGYTFPCDRKVISSGTTFDIFPCGVWMTLEPGQIYDLRILIGERPGGESGFWLMVEEKNHSYPKDPKNNKSPILPLFRLQGVKMPELGIGTPPFDSDTDLGWTALSSESDK